jgi:hypothetical protein
MDSHGVGTQGKGGVHYGLQMFNMAVYAPVGNETGEMQSMTAGRLDDLSDCRIVAQGAFAYRHIYTRVVLVHNPAGAKVQMADLGVSHLPGGKSDRLPGSLK